MRSPIVAACGAALLILAADLPAQDSQHAFRTAEDQAGLWFTYAGEHALSDRWALLFDGNVRRTEFASVWRSFLVRPAIQWRLNPAARFAAGYGFSYVYPAGNTSGVGHSREHRIFQQVLLSHTISKLSLSHRYRFENRWFEQTDTAAGAHSWLKRQRARYQIKGTFPLGSGRTYLSSFNEVFINLGANVRYNVFDSNRFAAGLGFRLTNTLRLESYYLNYVVLHADGRAVDRNHVWLTTLNSTQPFRRSKKSDS
jgi:hypothetical protein